MNSSINNNDVELSSAILSAKLPSMDYLLLENHEEKDMFRFILENHQDPVFLIKIEEDNSKCSFIDFNKLESPDILKANTFGGAQGLPRRDSASHKAPNSIL